MSKDMYFASLRGENLIPEDGKSCDPYVIVKVGTETFTTETISTNHINPAWTKLEKFILPWDGRNAMPEIELIAMDHDTVFSDDFLGYARIRLHPSMIGTEIRVLLGPRNENESKLLTKFGTLGHLFVRIEFVDTKVQRITPANTPDFSMVQPAAQQHGGVAQITPVRPGAAPTTFMSPNTNNKVAPQAGQAWARPPPQQVQPLSPGGHGYRITEVRAEGLQIEANVALVAVTVIGDTDEWRTCDMLPSANGCVEWSSMTVDVPAVQAVDPVTRETVDTLPIAGFVIVTAAPAESGKFRVVASVRVQLTPQMAGVDNQLTCDDNRSCIVFHMAAPVALRPQVQFTQQQQQFVQQQQHGTPYASSLDNRQQQQHQQPAFPAVAPAQQQQQALRPPPDGLVLEIISAHNLIPRDYEMQASDPFAIVLGMNARGDLVQLARTRTIQSCADPVWQQQLMLHTISPDIIALRVYVFDEDPNQTAEFLGQFSFDLSQMPHVGEGIFPLVSRVDGADSSDDARILKRFKRPDFGTIALRWALDSALVNRQRGMLPSAVQQQQQMQASLGPQMQSTVPVRTTALFDQPPVRAIESAPITNIASLSQVSTLTLTVLSVTNITSRCSPYVRVICGTEVRDNFRENIQEAQTVGMNFTSEFRMPRVNGGLQNGRAYPTRIELCDTHSAVNPVGVVLFDVPADTNTKFETRTFPVIRAAAAMQGSLPGPSDVIAEMTVLFKVGPFYATQAAPTDAVLTLTIVGAKALTQSVRNVKKFTNPYVIATVHSGATKQEYRTTTVENSRAPLWYFQLPTLDITPQDVAVLTVWDQDPYGFDEILGQTRLSIGSLMQNPTVVDLPLEGPPDAASRAASNFSSESFGHLTVEYTVTDRQGRSSASYVAESRIMEITVVEAKDLVESNYVTACVQMTVDDQSAAPQTNMTALTDKNHGRFDRLFTASVEGAQSQMRFTAFDYNDSRGTFLGECVLRLSQLGQSASAGFSAAGGSGGAAATAGGGSTAAETFVLPLRPRKDIRFHRDDVVLLNRSTRGLGTLKVMAKAYTIREYEIKRREVLKASGRSYNFVVQVADTADITVPGQYYIDVVAGGVHKASHVEDGVHPKFRKSFDFTLYDDMEMVSLALMRRVDGVKTREELVGDVTFPVMRPDGPHAQPVEQWLTLRAKSLNDTMAAKLFLRWRAFTAATAAPPAGDAQAARDGSFLLAAHGGGGGSKAASIAGGAIDEDVWRASNAGSAPHDNVAALQRELAAARREIAQLRDFASPAPLRVGMPLIPSAGPAIRPDPLPFSVNVFYAQNNGVAVYHGTTDATAQDVIGFCVREFRIAPAAAADLAVFYRQEPLPAQQPLTSYVREHETLMLAAGGGGSTSSSNAHNTSGYGGDPMRTFRPQEQHQFYQPTDDREPTRGPQDYFAASQPPPAPLGAAGYRGPSPLRGPQAAANAAYGQASSANGSNFGLTTSPHRGPGTPAATAVQRQNELVIGRVARMAERRESNFVSCFLVTKKTLESSDAGAIVDVCAQSRINGFCRPVRNGGIEFFIQATPEALAPVLQAIQDLGSADLLMEEARGYIPMLEVGFRVTRSRTEGAKMFEMCSAALNGDRSRCWFYKVDADPTIIGSRYIDERA